MRTLLLFLSFAVFGFCFCQEDKLDPALAFENSHVRLGWVQMNKKLSKAFDSLGVSKVITTFRSAHSGPSDENTDTLYIENGLVLKHVTYNGTTYEYLYSPNGQLTEKKTLFGGGYIDELERFMYDSLGFTAYRSLIEIPRLYSVDEVAEVSRTVEKFSTFYNVDGTPDSVRYQGIYSNYASHQSYDVYSYRRSSSNDSLIISIKANVVNDYPDTNYIVVRTSGDSTYVEKFSGSLGFKSETHVFLNGLPVDNWDTYKGVYQYSTAYGKLGLPAETFGREISAEGSFIMTYNYYRGKKRLRN